MHLDELLGNAQAKAQPALAEAEVARGVPAGIELGEERLEQVLERLRFQADSAILDDDLRLVGAVSRGRQLDLAAVGSELDRVGQQVDQDRADLVGVDLERPQVIGQLDLELDAGGRGRTAGPDRRPAGSARPDRPGCAASVLRKSSARSRVSMLVTSRASCRPLAVIWRRISCSWSGSVGDWRAARARSAPGPA